MDLGFFGIEMKIDLFQSCGCGLLYRPGPGAPESMKKRGKGKEREQYL